MNSLKQDTVLDADQSASLLSCYSFKYPPELDSPVVIQVDRVDDTGIFGSLLAWGGPDSCTAYLPIGSIGKEKGRGERKAQLHFLTRARRSLKHKGQSSNSSPAMTFVAYVQSIDQASRSGVADGSSLDIGQQLYHLTVTRRGVTDEIERATSDLSRDVQQCGRHLVDKAAALAGVPRRWARRVTMHTAYERSVSNATEEGDEEEKGFQSAKAPIDFLVNTIGALEASTAPQSVVDMFGESGGEIDEDKVKLFAHRLALLCRDEKQRRSQPINVSVTAYIGGPRALLSTKAALTPEAFDTHHLVSTFQHAQGPPTPTGCEPATVCSRGNGKYQLSTTAPPDLNTKATAYLNAFAVCLQDSWRKAAVSSSPAPVEPPAAAERRNQKQAAAVNNENTPLSMQPSINIGVIGDVANGKSTLVKAISGKRTQAHSSEQQKHGITIRLGFANAAVLQCENAGLCGAYSFLPESDDTASRLPACHKCGQTQKVVKRFSLIDCPGHAELMATMLAGASAFDAVLLAAAANVQCPTPQARQHLEAIKLSGAMDGNDIDGASDAGIMSIAIAQTKAELLADASKNAASRLSPEERLEHHAQQGRDNLGGSVAETAPIIPVCAPLGLGLEAIAEWIANIPSPTPPPASDYAHGYGGSSRLSVLRSFDVNRTNTPAKDIEGGVLGGKIDGAPIAIGDDLEVRPGLYLSDTNKKSTKPASKPKKKSDSEKMSASSFQVQPLRFRCTSLMTGKSPLSIAGKGGLVAVGTSLDPSICADNRMVGSVVGPPGTLPPVWGPTIYLNQLQFVDLVPETAISSNNHSKDTTKPSDILVKGAQVRCHFGSSTVKGTVARISKSARKVEIHLEGPVCAVKGSNVAIEAKEGRDSFILVAHAKLFGGDICLPGASAGANVESEPELEEHQPMAQPKDRPLSQGNKQDFIMERLREQDGEYRKQFLGDLQAYRGDGSTGNDGSSCRISVPLPDIARDGGAHVLLSNFGIMAHSLRRDATHWMSYLQKEGGLSCVLAGERKSPATTALRVRWKGGRNFAERFTSITRKYILAFVTCQQCRSAMTELNAAGNELLCRRCNARRFVPKL